MGFVRAGTTYGLTPLTLRAIAAGFVVPGLIAHCSITTCWVLAGNGADTALAGRRRAEAKAVCALTPHPPHSKTLARGPGLAVVQVRVSGDSLVRTGDPLREAVETENDLWFPPPFTA